MTIAPWKAGLFAVAALTSLATMARADDAAPAESPWGPFSATIALTSDYRFRGQSQTDRDPAIQGSLDYTHASGIFAGIWGSNIDFNDVQDTSVEIDLYAGYTHAFSENTEGTVKVVYYWYPDSDPADYDYFELIASLSHNFGKFSLGGEVAWSPDYFAETGDAIAFTGTVEVPLAESFWFFDGGLAASGHLGHQSIDDNAGFGTPDYLFWDVGLAATAGVFTLDARYVDTDLSNVECFFGTDLCEGGFVGTVSVGLPG